MVEHAHEHEAATKAADAASTAQVPGKKTLTQDAGAAPGAAAAAQEHEWAQRIATLGHHLEGTVTTWNAGLDVLNLPLVQQAGEQAMSDWIQMQQAAAMLTGTPTQAAAEQALAAARDLIAQLGLFHYQSQKIAARAPHVDSPPAYVVRSLDRAERCLADVVRLHALTDGVKRGADLDDDAKEQIAAIFEKHSASDEESRWIGAVLRGLGRWSVCLSLGGDFGTRVRCVTGMQSDEIYFENIRTELDPATLLQLEHDAADIELFIANDAYGWRYTQILEKYPPDTRVHLLHLLAHRHQLENMVHRGGGDDVIRLIHECPAGFSQWEYDYSKVTVKSDWDKVSDAATEMVDELPGAALEFAGGVYHEMGHLPAIGPVFERAGKSFDDLAKVTDDAIGVDQNAVKTRNAIASGTGHVVAAIGESGVGGEAAAVQDVKRAYDAGNAVQRAAGLVLEVRDGFTKAKEKWETVTGIVSEVATGLTELTTDSIAGDKDRWHHAVDHIDAVIDLALEKLGGMEGAAMGGAEGRVKQAAKDDAAERKKDAMDAAGKAAASQELRDEHDATIAAANRAAHGRSAQSRAKGAADLKVHAAKVRQLASQEAAQVAEARDAAGKAADDEQAQLRDLQKAGDRVGYYKEQLGEVVQEAIVGFTVGALKGAKKELKKAVDRMLDGKAADLDGKQILKSAITQGATDAVMEVVMPRVKRQLTTWFEKAIGALLAEIDEELRGAASLADDKIEEAIDWGLDQLGVDEKVEHFVEGLVDRAFGGEEGEGGEKAEDANESTHASGEGE